MNSGYTGSEEVPKECSSSHYYSLRLAERQGPEERSYEKTGREGLRSF